MTAYYNEIDAYAAEWLENQIAAGIIAPGVVDRRSIRDVRPDDLRGFSQCHFFAGIGLWSHALRMAGWADDRPVWTGSCPCQPFSAAGKRKGEADERHLWPVFGELIRQCGPATVFGEQVASKDGRHWLAGVRLDLERMGYAVGAADLCAAGVGAPHIRQRLYWVANADKSFVQGFAPTGEFARLGTDAGYSFVGMGDAASAGRERQRRQPGARSGREVGFTGPPMPHGFWSTAEVRTFGDGKARRVKPGISLLAHGIPARTNKLRAIGNAIVPQVAAQFVQAFLECRP